MAGRGSHIPPGVRSVFIPVFENKTMEPIIEEELTPAVIQEFLRDGRINVANHSAADIVLKGTVVAYKETPVSFDATQNVLEYRIAVTTRLRLQETLPSGNPLWEKDITSTAEYRVSSDVMTTRVSKLTAFKEIARNLSEEVVDRVMLGW